MREQNATMLRRIRKLILVVGAKQASVAGRQDVVAYRPEAHGQYKINVFV